MRRLFRILISILIVTSMILTTGVDIIQEDTSEIEIKAKEAPAKEDPPKIVLPKEEPAKDEPTKEEPAKEEQPKEEPAKEDPPKEEPPNKEPAKEDPLVEPPLGDEDKEEENQENVEGEENKENQQDEENQEENKTEENEEEEVVLDPLEISLTDARTLIENSITLGLGTDPSGENYMSEPTGGDGNYSYEWRVLGQEEVFYEGRYPTIYPKEIPQINPMINTEETISYQLTLKDGSGLDLTRTMTLTVEDPRGSIEITNIVENRFMVSSNIEFDIFVSGSDGSLYTVSLKNGDSTTLRNLKRANYTIETIAPMNHKLLEIPNNNISIAVNSLDHAREINHIRTNSSWFYSR